MSIRITPDTWTVDSDVVSDAIFKVKNHGGKTVMFAVLTNNPEGLRVSQLYGFLKPRGEVTIEVHREPSEPQEDCLVVRVVDRKERHVVDWVSEWNTVRHSDDVYMAISAAPGISY